MEVGIRGDYTFIVTKEILALHSTSSLSILYASIVLFINRKYTSNFSLIILAAPINRFTLVNYKLNQRRPWR